MQAALSNKENLDHSCIPFTEKSHWLKAGSEAMYVQSASV